MAHHRRLWLCMITVYFFWGSTFLGIRFAVNSCPPLLAMGVRLLIASTLLIGVGYWRGSRFRGVHWRNIMTSSVLLFALPLACLAIVEQTAPSHLMALCNGAIPIWTVLLNCYIQKKAPLTLSAVGIVVCCYGLYLLLMPEQQGIPIVPWWILGMVTLGTFSWSTGAMMTRHSDLPSSPTFCCGLQQLVGGMLLLAMGYLVGEWRMLQSNAVSFESAAAIIYLVISGSWLAYPCYTWAVRNASPVLTTTFAYVNPLVALLLGWGLGGEVLHSGIVSASAMICGGVALVGYAETKIAVTPCPANSC